MRINISWSLFFPIDVIVNEGRQEGICRKYVASSDFFPSSKNKNFSPSTNEKEEEEEE